jgi:protein SCO1/2
MKLKPLLLALPAFFLFTSTAGHTALSKEILAKIGLEPNTGTQLPLNIAFRDETGRRVPLQTYFGTRPVLLSLVYYQCPSLCPQTLGNLAKNLAKLSPRARGRLNILIASIDPRETPRQALLRRHEFVKKIPGQDSAVQVAFLTGSPQAIRPVAKTVGLHYAFDSEYGQFAHAAGLIILSPNGTIQRYFYGSNYAPRDLRLASLEADPTFKRSLMDKWLLFCYRYDAVSGRYVFPTARKMEIGLLSLIALMAGWLIGLHRKERPLPYLSRYRRIPY